MGGGGSAAPHHRFPIPMAIVTAIGIFTWPSGDGDISSPATPRGVAVFVINATPQVRALRPLTLLGKEHPSMKLVAYLRVSTDRQAEEGFGLDVQHQSIKKWCKQHDHRIVAVTADEGVSGTVQAEDRPGLADALALIRHGRAEGLVVARLDRLARSLAVQEAALAVVWRHGGTVFSVDQGEVVEDDPEDPMRRAMRLMVGVFSELERATITARLRARRRMKAEQGGFAYGAPGFGHRAENRDLVPDDEEQATLVRIAELRSAGCSVRAICRQLEAEGRRPKRGQRWHPGSLNRILHRLESARPS